MPTSSLKSQELKKKKGIFFGRQNDWYKVKGNNIKYMLFILIKKKKIGNTIINPKPIQGGAR